MRTVVSGREVPHLWAHQTQSTARGASLSFEGRRIYSYAEHEGTLIDVPGMGMVALLNANNRRSMTTQKHMGMIRGAVRHLPSFEVPHIGGRYSDDIDHPRNIQWFNQQIIDLAKKVRRARSNREWLAGSLNRMVRTAQRYAQTFALDATFAPPSDESLANILAAEKALEKQRAAEERARQEAREREQAKRLERWMAGENVDGYFSLRFDRMRIVGEEIQTTRGVRVPTDHVVRALPIVLRILSSGRTYKRNGHTVHVGHYTVDEITADGQVICGCHTFERGEVERIAALLGVTVA